ncbi:MAG: hypothetical protein IKJ80_05560 [Clostridia bacterium]|nr:hypothetical protein [Clostridia bacterium]
MKKDFFDAMGEIGDDLLSEAHGTKKPVFVNWRKPLIAAACIALVAALGIGSAFMLTDAPDENPTAGEYTSTVDTSPKKPQSYTVLSWSDLLGGKTDGDEVNSPSDDTVPDLAPPEAPALPEYTMGGEGIMPSPVETGEALDDETLIADALAASYFWYVPARGGACEVIMITGVPSGTPFEEILAKYLDYCGYPIDVEYSAERVGERTETSGELVTHYPGVGVANVVLSGRGEPDELMYKCLVNTVITSTSNSFVNIDYNGKSINIGGVAATEGNAFFPLSERLSQDVDITTGDIVTGIDTLEPVPDDSTVPNTGYDTDTPVSEISPEAMECYYFLPHDGGYRPERYPSAHKMDGIDFVADFFYLSEIEDVKPVSVTFGQLASGEINARVRLWMRDGVELGDLALKCLVNSLLKTYGCDTVSIYDYTGKAEKELLINGEPAPYGAFELENTDRTDAPDTTAASPYIPTPETTPSWGYEETTSSWGYEETMYPLPNTTPVFPSDTVEDLLPPAAGMTLYVPTEDGGVTIEAVSADVEYSSVEVLEIYIEKLSEAKVKVVYFAMGLDHTGAPEAKLDLKWGASLSDTELKCIVNTVIDSFNVRYVKLFANGEDCYIDGVTFEDDKGFEWFEI